MEGGVANRLDKLFVDVALVDVHLLQHLYVCVGRCGVGVGGCVSARWLLYRSINIKYRP